MSNKVGVGAQQPQTVSKNATSKGSQMTTIQGDQVNTISGGATAELNYQNTQQTQPAIVGPQLHFDKNQLCMMTPVTVTAQDQVVLKNIGSTTVTYDWKKIIRNDFVPSKNSDGVQRFYCHYPHGVLKPGESKTFTFSFRSAEKPGMFFEEWELITDPQMLTPLPTIYLSGIATLNDDKRQKSIQEEMEKVSKKIKSIQAQEREKDLLAEVKEPEAPAPDMRNPETFKKFFEQNNRHLGLYYSQSVMNQLYELIEDILMRSPDLSGREEEIYLGWNGNLDYVENLLIYVANPYSRNSFNERYMRILSQARKVPIDRAQSFGVIRTMLLSLSEVTIDFEQKARDEIQTIANPGFIVPHEAMTPEEIKNIEVDRKNKKADWYKATKKKPKTDDEEAQEAEDIKVRTQNALKNELISNRLTKIGKEIDILRTKWLMENHIKMDRKEYDDLYHLESVLDIDVAGKDIILRVDLDVPLSNYVPPPTESQMNTYDDASKSQTKENTKGTTRKSGKGTGKEDPAEAEKAKRKDEPWKGRDILDHTFIKRAANELRYLTQERAVNRTWVLGNLADRAGKVKPENSMKIIHNALQKQLADQQLLFVDDAIIPDFEHKRDNEVFPEQATFILENLNFKPDEFGYVEPEKPSEDAKAAEEEAKRLAEEEKKQAELAAQAKGGKPGAPPAKAPAPADKKKEEEAKKKAEEEAAAAKKKAEEMALSSSGGKVLSEEERAEQQRKKEEEERKKREAEYFDYKTIHKYKRLLGRYGDIYVNDAPMMSLTNSNSVAEIKCKRKVMGVKMTDEVRKLCLFFLKKHPKDISDLWYNQPTEAGYHEKEFSSVIGGSIHSVQDILDRILLCNALLDQSKVLYLNGQFGLAALMALGVKIGNVEFQSEVEQTAEFFHILFVKAIEKQAKIYFPKDFLVASQADIAHGKQEQQEYEQKLQQELLKAQQAKDSMQNTANSKTGGANKTGQKTGQSNNGQTGATSQSALHQSQELLQQSHPSVKTWVDRLVQQGKTKDVKITEKIATLWNQIVKQVHAKYVEKGIIAKEVAEGPNGGYRDHPLTQPSVFFLPGTFTQHVSSASAAGQDHDTSMMSAGGQPADQSIIRQTTTNIDLKADEVIIDFSDETRNQLFIMLNRSFKLLWDGSLSPHPNDPAASLTNKIFVEQLLDLRIATQNDDEPPVTLIHAPETEQVVKQALLKIKIEHQEAAEEAKRRAKEAKLAAKLARGDDEDAEEEEEEEEQKENMTQDDGASVDNSGGISHELHQIADFMVFDIPQFTTKLMQGVVNKSLLAMSAHRRKPKNEVEEELFLLDEI